MKKSLTSSVGLLATALSLLGCGGGGMGATGAVGSGGTMGTTGVGGSDDPAGAGGTIGAGGITGGSTGGIGGSAGGSAAGAGGTTGASGSAAGSGGGGGSAAGSGGRGGSATGSGGGGGSAAGSGGRGGSTGGSTGSGGTLPRFSFFVTSLGALRTLSGSQNGFGGDLCFGETGAGAGLRGADKICTTIAEMSMPGAGGRGAHFREGGDRPPRWRRCRGRVRSAGHGLGRDPRRAGHGADRRRRPRLSDVVADPPGHILRHRRLRLRRLRHRGADRTRDWRLHDGELLHRLVRSERPGQPMPVGNDLQNGLHVRLSPATAVASIGLVSTFAARCGGGAAKT